MKLREIFSKQYDQMASKDQHFYYILKSVDGQKSAERISHWKIISLTRECGYNKLDQVGHYLPVFTEKRKSK
jgi:hypothetical protein